MSILIPCAQQKDKDELLQKNDTFIFTDFDGAIFENLLAGIKKVLPERYRPDNYIQELYLLADKHHITELLNTCDYPGSIYTSVLGRERNLIVPSIESILVCQHKYYARCLQKKYVPEATPQFAIVAKNNFDAVRTLSFPLFIKPVKSYLSAFARPIYTMHELETYLSQVAIPEQFLMPFNWAIKKYTDYAYDGSYFIAEELLRGRQVTLEGYVWRGEVGLIGIVDSIMIPETISFERFVYSSSLPEGVQRRMFAIAHRFIQGIRLDMSLFNMEFMYDHETDEIYIIEINPRMSGQFCDLFKMVNGKSNYEVLYDIVKGRKPIVHQDGRFALAASLVCRQRENKKVLCVPTEQQIAAAQKRFSELRFYPWIKAGDKLSDVLQDGTSYVYCWIHLGAQSKQELEEKYEESKKLLPFNFENC